jgi:hypothetical protein
MSKFTVKNTLMKNHRAAELLPLQNKFQALQLADDLSLFLTIDEKGDLRVFEETNSSDNGWEIKNICKSIAKQKNGAKVKAKDFSAQKHENGIMIAIVTTTNGQDELYFNNSIQDIFNCKEGENINWTACPYNGTSPAITKADISNIKILPQDQKQKLPILIAGVKNDKGKIHNFTINEEKKWQEFIAANDFDKVLSESVGKAAVSDAQGLYQLIQNNNSKGIVFTPNSRRIPIPVKISPPQTAFKISAVEETPAGGNTDLFIGATDGIYLVKSASQKKGETAIKIIEGSYKEFEVFKNDDRYTIFANTDKGEGVYFKGDANSLTDPRKWKASMPIVKGINRLSFYADTKNDNLTLFAQKDKGLFLIFHQNSQNGMWHKREVLLPTLNIQQVITYVAHASHIKVDTDQPSAKVKITSVNECDVFINGSYYRLSPTKETVIKTDIQKSINIEQKSNNMDAPSYFLQLEGDSERFMVNPTGDLLEKLEKVKNGSDLAAIELTDERGRKKPLISKNIPKKKVDAVAENIKKFVALAKKMPQDGSRVQINNKSTTTISSNSKKVESGDFFSYVADTVSEVTSFVIETIDGVITAVAEIAGQIFEFVIQCVSDVINAIGVILEQVMVFIEEVIQWIGFIFSWDDIINTKNVIKGTIKLQARSILESVDEIKTNIETGFDEMKKAIDEWAGLPPVDKQIDDMCANPEYQNKGLNSPEANYGINHFKKGVNQLQMRDKAEVKMDQEATTLIGSLENLLKNQASEIQETFELFKKEILDDIGNKSIGTIFQKLIGIVGRLAVGTAKNIVVLMMDMVKIILSAIIDVLEATIYIPVLSWLYKEITGSDLSFIDLISLIPAIPATIYCKIILNKAPFTEEFSQKMVNLPKDSQPVTLANTNTMNAVGVPSPPVVNLNTGVPQEVSDGTDIIIRGLMATTYIASTVGVVVSSILEAAAAFCDGIIDIAVGFKFRVAKFVSAGLVNAPFIFEFLSCHWEKVVKETKKLPGYAKTFLSIIFTPVGTIAFDVATTIFRSYWVPKIPFWLALTNGAMVVVNLIASVLPRFLTSYAVPVISAIRLIPMTIRVGYEFNERNRNRTIIFADIVGNYSYNLSVICNFGDFYVMNPLLLKIKAAITSVAVISRPVQGALRLTVDRIY